MRKLTLLILSILMACSVCARADQRFLAEYMQIVFSEDSSIPITQANMVLQSREGYIWVASYDGLIRYDGKNARVFHVAEGINTSNITTLLEDQQGRLWVGTNDAGVFIKENSTFRAIDTEQRLPSSSVRAMAQGDGCVYVATVNGLVRISTDDFSIKLMNNKAEPVFAISLAKIGEDRLLCVLNDGSVLIFQGDELVTEYARGDLSGYDIYSAYMDSHNNIYLGTRSNAVMILTQNEAPLIMSTGTKRNINTFYEDSSGRIWICSDTGIGFFFDGIFHSVDGAYIESSVENVIEDYEGNYWFSSSRKGLLHIVKSKFRNITAALEMPELTVNATMLVNDQLYIAADEGVFVYTKEKQINNKLTSAMKGVRTRNIAMDDAGNLLFSTYSGDGLVIYTPEGEISRFDSHDGLTSKKVRSSIPLPGESIAVGTADGITIIQDGKLVQNFTKADGLVTPIILSMVYAPDGYLYAGSDGGGVYRIDLQSREIRNFTEADGLTSGVILRMAVDPQYDDIIWTSMGNGFGYFKDEHFYPVERLNGYSSSIFDIKFIADDIWLLTSTGILILNRDNLLNTDQELDYIVLDKRDGIEYAITANSWSWLAENGTLYMACTQGVTAINTREIYHNSTVPKLAINNVIVDDDVYTGVSEITLPADATRLTFNYAMLSYISSSGNYVSVYLEGFDSEPSLISTDFSTSVSYTNLNGGSYKLHLKGINKSGTESEDLIFPVHVQYHLLEHTWAQILVIAAILSASMFISFLIYSSKTKAMLKRQQEYRAITDQAIMAIADSIDAKDKYTSGHSKRVAFYSLEIAKRMGLHRNEREDLYYAALLHDIGKIGLEDQILNKNGRLTDEEYIKMKRHPEIGGDILKSITVIENIAIGAKYHHERFDGKGYPEGLTGQDIPLFARIICVADAYDAMTSNRPYRDSLTVEYVLSELERGRDAQFDSEIVEHMIDIMKKGIKPE